MRRKNFHFIGKLQQLVMQAAVEHGRKLLRGVVAGEIGAANVSHKQRVSGEYGSWPGMVDQVSHCNTNALQGVTWRLKKVETALAKPDGIAVFNRSVRERSAGAFAEINARRGALGKLMMTGNEVGVEVGFDNVLDLQVLSLGGIKVNVNVALRINDRGDSVRIDQVRSMGQAAQIEVFDLNRCHFLP